MSMKPAVVRMPTVQIPTLKATNPQSSGLGSLVSSSATWDTQHAVLIEDLVQGVQQCQQAAKRAQDTLRRQKSDEATSRRTRSPLPIAERKPWGANATPRNRPSSATTAAQPATEKKAVAARTSRSSTPDPAAAAATAKAQPPSRHQSPPTANRVTAPATSTRPKLPHHTPPTPTPRSDSPSLSARSSTQKTHAGVVPPASGPLRSAMLEAMLEETVERVQRLEKIAESANDRAKSAENRCEQLEQAVRLLTQKLSQQQEEISRVRTTTTTSTTAASSMTVVSMQPTVAASLPISAITIAPQQFPSSTLPLPPAPLQLHPYPFPSSTSQQQQHRTVVSLAGAPPPAPVAHPTAAWWVPSHTAEVEEEIDGVLEDEVSSNDEHHVARKLDLSSDSSKSVTRAVPPQPPLNLRLA